MYDWRKRKVWEVLEGRELIGERSRKGGGDQGGEKKKEKEKGGGKV